MHNQRILQDKHVRIMLCILYCTIRYIWLVRSDETTACRRGDTLSVKQQVMKQDSQPSPPYNGAELRNARSTVRSSSPSVWGSIECYQGRRFALGT